MTNEQTAILLEKIKAMLDNAIANSEEIKPFLVLRDSIQTDIYTLKGENWPRT